MLNHQCFAIGPGRAIRAKGKVNGIQLFENEPPLIQRHSGAEIQFVPGCEVEPLLLIRVDHGVAMIFPMAAVNERLVEMQEIALQFQPLAAVRDDLCQRWLHRCDSALYIDIPIVQLFQPIFELSQLLQKFFVLRFGDQKHRLAVNFNIKKLATAEALSPNVLEPAGTALALVEQMAAPQELDASLGIAILLSQHMKNGHPVLEFGMPDGFAPEYIESFVWIQHRSDIQNILLEVGRKNTKYF